MSGETESNISGWTVDTLHAHFAEMLRQRDTRADALFREKDLRDQQRFDAQQLALRDALIAQEKAVNAALSAAQEAVQKAETAAEKRFDAVNEFRGQLADQARDLMPRKETETLIKNLSDKIETLEDRGNEIAGRRGGMQESWGYLVGAVGVLLAIAGFAVAVLR